MINPKHEATLRALGVLPPERPHEAARASPPRDPQGRFTSPDQLLPGVNLGGGYQPPPPAPKDPEADHARLLAQMAQAPRQLPPLERD